MALKDEWKNTGKDLGHAFAGLGKNIGRSASDGIDKMTGENGAPDNSTVFNDGSWRTTGKDLGGAFAGLGRSLIHSVQKGVDALDDATSKDAPSDEKQ